MFGSVPGLQVIASYRRRWLLKDVIAGVVLTTLLVPQGMAYAELAGLPPITGLYTSILCLLGYAVFGPSRILVLGPDSSLGPMIAATILPLMAADGDAKRAVALASILAIMVAAIMFLAAVAKLGFIADLISKPTMIGYMNGLALTILIGQLSKLLGFKVKADGLIGEVPGFAKGLAHATSSRPSSPPSPHSATKPAPSGPPPTSPPPTSPPTAKRPWARQPPIAARSLPSPRPQPDRRRTLPAS